MQEKMLTNINTHINIKLFSFKLIDNVEYIVNLQCIKHGKNVWEEKNHNLLLSLLIENEGYTENIHWTSILVNGLNGIYTEYIFIKNILVI